MFVAYAPEVSVTVHLGDGVWKIKKKYAPIPESI